MALVTQNEAHENPVERLLPSWWRCVLVALATIILCSCAAPAMQDPVANGENVPERPSPPMATQTVHAAAIEITQSDCPANGSCTDNNVARGPAGATALDPYGPLVGPSDEYLCDGGDFVTPAGVRADWTVAGVEEEDAISHYDTVDGRVVVVPSNRVCIYAPRFAAVRRVVNLVAHEQPQFINEMREEQVPIRAIEVQPFASSRQRHAVAVDVGQRPASLFRQREQAGGLENLQATMDAYTSLAAYANLEIVRTGEVSAAKKPRLAQSIQSAITWTGDQAPQVVFGVKQAHAMVGVRQPGIVYQTDEPNRPRLRLLKLASRGHALPGEEIEFTLRFDNIGDQVIGNVTIVDNLSTRLEYIPNSAKSSVDANFLTESTAEETTLLRWEIKDPVEPGAGGVLRFRVRVR